jgi:putative ABC transport system permease protein
MNDDFNKIYLAEQKIDSIFISFAVFAILIACFGLFGLVAYAAEQHTKEIDIRKVLGASVGNIAGMLSKDFNAGKYSICYCIPGCMVCDA